MGMAVGGGGAAGGRRGRRRARGAVMSEINMTPFIDVMLVLLIIFMVAAPMMTVGVPVDLPKSKAAALEGQVKPIAVSIKADGKLYIQDAEVTRDQLVPKLQALVPTPADTSIQVRADKASNYGRLSEILGDMQSAGFRKFNLNAEGQ